MQGNSTAFFHKQRNERSCRGGLKCLNPQLTHKPREGRIGNVNPPHYSSINTYQPYQRTPLPSSYLPSMSERTNDTQCSNTDLSVHLESQPEFITLSDHPLARMLSKHIRSVISLVFALMLQLKNKILIMQGS
jgi:hypothetical protein